METKDIIQLTIQLCVVLFSFFLGRYTSYKSDRRMAMKEMNELFLKPFISLYENTHHAYALRIVDFPLEVQQDMISLLLDNKISLSPYLQSKIIDFDCMYSGYSETLKNNDPLSEDEMKEIEETFMKIYRKLEKQYKSNSRKLYCSYPKRIWYFICDIFYFFKWKLK